MGKKLKLEEIAFKNEIGQTINPGDQVLIVRSGWGHQTYLNAGTYLGIVGGSHVKAKFENEQYDPKIKKYAKVPRTTTLQLNRIYKLHVSDSP